MSSWRQPLPPNSDGDARQDAYASQTGPSYAPSRGASDGVAIDMVEMDDINNVSDLHSQPTVPANFALMNSFARAKYLENQRYDSVEQTADVSLDIAPTMTKHRRILGFAAAVSFILGVVVVIVANVTDDTRFIDSTVDAVYIGMTIAGIMAIVVGSLAASAAYFLRTKFLGATIAVNAVIAIICVVFAIISLSTDDSKINEWAEAAWTRLSDEQKASWTTSASLAHKTSQNLLGMGIIAVLLLAQSCVTAGAAMAIYRRKSDHDSLLKREAVLQERIAQRKRLVAEQALRTQGGIDSSSVGGGVSGSGGMGVSGGMGGSPGINTNTSTNAGVGDARVERKRESKQAVSQAMLHVPVPRGQ